MTPLKVLEAARGLISDERAWTQEEYARTAEGIQTWCGHDAARAWCAIGAVRRVAHDNTPVVRVSQMILAEPVATVELAAEESIVAYNDTHTHAEVLALFDTAIARLEREAANG